MHYITARKLISSIPFNAIESVERGDVGLCSYLVKTRLGYNIHIQALFNWIHIYKDGKMIARLVENCHLPYLRSFMIQVCLAIHNGAECKEHLKRTFEEDLDNLKPYR